MQLRLSRQWLRRLAAHLTTPLIVGILWSLLIVEADEDSWGDLWGAVVLSYLAWLFLGLPGALFRSRRQRPSLWRYIALGSFFAAFPFFLFPSNLTSASWLMSMAHWVPIGAAAGLWYWLCAYWRAPPNALEPSEPRPQPLG